MGVIEVSTDYGGRVLTLQTGKIAKQTDASVLARYGDTVVLVTVVAAKTIKEGQSFFPLTVDFLEKYYSAGRVPGGFFKREAKPSDRATLSARMIDRPLRPLFPEDFLAETHVVATVLSIDGVNEADVVASIAASAAMHISDIPWAGPIATCRVGWLNDEFVVNPSPADQPNSSLELLVSGVRSGVIMVEGAAKEIPEKQLMDAIDFAHEKMQPIMDLIDELRTKVGKPKREYIKPPKSEPLKKEMRSFLWSRFEKAFAVREKLARYEALSALEKEAKVKFTIAAAANDEDKAKNSLIGSYFEELKGSFARELTLSTKARIDGRRYDEIRPIECEVGLLPRVHGSALFTRGETQVLAAVTLGTSEDEQKIDSITGIYQKTFMLHYNFPPYSVGEARPMRPPGRREIGHGFLAERAISYILPPKDKFPYTVRLVSEVLESNGSSSMATVCSGSLALMDAGVPIPKPVAGVAMGLIKEGESIAVLSDILGDEDHLGDMDFKVCGTADGITAFQMDLKIGGVNRIIMEQALEQAREGRLHILGKMALAMEKPREDFSPYAPRIFTIKVKPDKVREVIGSGGKVIRSIIERTGVKIDIEDDGSINIASTDNESAKMAIEIINQIVQEPEIGKVYEGRVTRIAEFGAFVEIIPGTDGLCHISELDHFRVRRVEDVVKEGEIIKVKCLDVDSQGKIRLSRKALLPKTDGPEDAGGGGGADGPGRGGRGGDRAERPEGRPERPEGRGDREAAPEREVRPPRPERPEGRGDREAAPEREVRPPRPDRPEGRGDRPDREARPERAERRDRPEGRGDRPEREARPERAERPDRPEGRGDRPDREARPERTDRPARPEGRGDRPERDVVRGDREPRGDREVRPERGADRDVRPERGADRDARPDRGGDRGGRDRGARGGVGVGVGRGGDRDRSEPRRFDAPRADAPRSDAPRGAGAGRYGEDRGNRVEGGRDRGGEDRGNRVDRHSEDRGNRMPREPREDRARAGAPDRSDELGNRDDRGNRAERDQRERDDANRLTFDRSSRSIGAGRGERGGRGERDRGNEREQPRPSPSRFERDDAPPSRDRGPSRDHAAPSRDREPRAAGRDDRDFAPRYRDDED